MLGDGLNDAGAFMKASLAIALTENTSQFTPASDGIMKASLLPNFDSCFKFLKNLPYIIYTCFTLSFCYNFVGLFFALQAKLSPIFTAIIMPLSSLSVIGFSFILTRALASYLGLGRSIK